MVEEREVEDVGWRMMVDHNMDKRRERWTQRQIGSGNLSWKTSRLNEWTEAVLPSRIEVSTARGFKMFGERV